MKKLVSLLLALAVVLSTVSAFALVDKWQDPNWQPGDNTPQYVCPPAINTDGLLINTDTSKKVHKYNNWVANLDNNTHSCDGKTVDCEFEYFTIDGVQMYVCPVCGNLNGETVVPEVTSSYLKVTRLKGTALIPVDTTARDPYHIKWNTNGKYIVRMMAMPNDSEAAYLITTCHEIGGVCRAAECVYTFTVPVDGRDLTLKKAYFGGLRDIDGYVRAGVDGLQIRPTKPSSSFGAFLLMK